MASAGPMDVEDSTPLPNPTVCGESSNDDPETVTGGGGAAAASSGEASAGGAGAGRGGNNPLLPPVSVAAAAAMVGNGGSPEDCSEPPGPSVPEVALVPLPPNFDLDAYISRYSGYTKLRRLDWISQRCPALAPDCYRTSLKLLRNGTNTVLYREMTSRARQLLGPEYAEDTEWVEQVDRRYHQQVDRLDAELNSYKTNLIKESIRIGYNELADLSYRRGDLKTALKCYARTRDYCTTNRHSAEMCLHVIEISADMRNFVHVNNYVLKAEHTPDLDVVVEAKLRAAAGLVFLEAREYAKAARKFVEVSPELGSTFDGVVAPEDVAVYGGLCALATFGREEIKRRVLENASFKNFLDLVPQMRELIHDFSKSRYKSCLTYLANMKGDLQLDLYLHAHLDTLYKLVEDKCLMQYFSPFISVRLGSMAEAFGMEVAEVESKVAALIISNQISARIDSTNATLHAKHTDQRSVSCRKMLEMGDEYRRELRAMLVRMSCIEHEFVVRNRSINSLGERPSAGGMEALLDDQAGLLLASLGEGGGSGGAAAGGAVGVAAATSSTGTRDELEESAGGGDAERPPEAGGGSSSMPAALDDVMDTVS